MHGLPPRPRGRRGDPPQAQARRRVGIPRPGLHHGQDGRPERALTLYREAAELDGGSAEAHAGAARILAALGRWEEAIPEYRRASELDPHSVESNRGLGNALLNLGRVEMPSSTTAVRSRSIRASPRRTSAWQTLF